MIEHKHFMQIVDIVASCSYAERAKVGAIIVKDKNIIAIGYNGTCSGMDNCCEIDGETKPEVLHAESNAILKCAKNGNSSNDAILYCSYSPCLECAKLIIQSGIIEVYFKHQYRQTSGLDLLKKANILTKQL